MAVSDTGLTRSPSRWRKLVDLWFGAAWSELLGAPDPDGSRLRVLRLHRAILGGLLVLAFGYILCGLPIMLEASERLSRGAFRVWRWGLTVGGVAALGGLLVEGGRIVRGDATSRLGYRPVGEALFLQILVLLWATVLLLGQGVSVGGHARSAVHLLYDETEFPRAGYQFGFAALGLVGRGRYGPGEVRVAPLNERTLQEARDHGRFLLVASHGCRRGLYWGGRCHDESVLDRDRTSALQYAYLSGCRTGEGHARWQAALGVSELRAFRRLSSPPEHIVWMWSIGPFELLRLPDRVVVQAPQSPGAD